MKNYTLAGGCFWCLDAVFRRVKGVTHVLSGYTGGDVPNPTYEQVASGKTGHAEAVQISFDETVIPGDVILDLFFLIHDPTTPNRQGNDVGTQYRSAMFHTNTACKEEYEAAKKRAAKIWKDPVVTEIDWLKTFYPAEDYHQYYYDRNPAQGYCSVVIAPKIVKARAKFTKWLYTEKEEEEIANENNQV
jgi:peptide-methionine (S)-S-oxide reductase